MSLNTAFRSALLGAAFALPAAASAQSASLPTPDPAAFEVTQTDGDRVVAHKQSGGICPMELGGLPLAKTHNLRPSDGTNVACQYDLQQEDGLSRVTGYIYTYRGAEAESEYQAAKGAIRQVSERSAIAITEKPEWGQTCNGAISLALVAAAVNDDPDQPHTVNQWATIYHYDIPAMNGDPARSETSLLSVYEAGDWMVKTRINIPGNSEDDAKKVCDLALSWIQTQADAIGD
ncbi:hypothetical protein [Pontixanthobacter aquaemixtae]|uniref:DUF3558 domain-containing protein n=1 Tax=Pontixanthobacter aquaemixtae TaxID=1958940 RepID=A0A844ZPZ0_9SPHN|nr:hypothetical protein [Pontixanthobacter aquaemixtae]MXO89614.1 hypothetical protein [Pontixanthobacter aquaemixtae]